MMMLRLEDLQQDPTHKLTLREGEDTDLGPEAPSSPFRRQGTMGTVTHTSSL